MSFKTCSARCYKLGHGLTTRNKLFNFKHDTLKNCLNRNLDNQRNRTTFTSSVILKNNATRLPFHRNFRSTSAARFSRTCVNNFNFFGRGNVNYIVNVKTGDQLHAGTDANVYIVLHSESGHKTDPIKLDYFFRDDFERGQLDEFQLKNVSNIGDIHKIEIWRDNFGIGFTDWFVDYIEIVSAENRKQFVFPVFRWIKPEKRYVIHHMDNYLPQHDPEPESRLEQLEEKRRNYECATKVPDGPAQVTLIYL